MDKSTRLSRDNHLQLPDEPGVYKFFDKTDDLIYVGKAKSLKKRVSSYFNKLSGANFKTHKLSKEIRQIEYAIVSSEFDAFLLENNLIKEFQPKYNIRLRDDKSFPYICIVNERFPRIYHTRRYDLKKGEYFGPYSNVIAMKSVLDLIRKLYTIRTCNYNLSEANVKAGKFKICLEYHLGNCQGPCEGLQTEEDYMEDIEHAKQILKGNINLVKKHFVAKMKEYSQELKFELAQVYKEKLDLLEKFQSKTMVVNPKTADTDVFTLIGDDDYAYLNFLKIRNGSIVNSENQQIQKRLNEEDEDIISLVALDIRNKYRSEAREIISNVGINGLPEDCRNTIPSRGDKKTLVDLSLKNAFFYRKELIKMKVDQKKKKNETLVLLQKDLRLKTYPRHIECFDNSNFQGTDPVAAMVCFRDGKPSKNDYRKFNIKTVEGPDDFASMYEIVYRRYSHLMDVGEKLPDLIVVDGGKGQLNAACQALKDLAIYGEVPVIGIAKRLEEIYYPEDPLPLHINKISPSLKLIQKLRDEAHRFAITFHRDKRSKSTIKTSLETIPGIGQATTNKLLSHFKSLKKIRLATRDEIVKVIGESKTATLLKHLK